MGAVRSNPRRWRLIAGLAAIGCAGCARNEIALVDTDVRTLPDAGALVERIALDRCVWWQAGDSLVVTAQRGPVRPAGSARQRVDLSFVFGGLPAEQSREYQLNSDSLRAYVRQGPTHHRFRSAAGIAAVWLLPGGELRVRFRVVARRENFHILTGWSTVGETLLLGEWVAHHDEAGGVSVLQRSEADGMTRSGRAHIPVDRRPRPVQIHGPPLDAGETNAPAGAAEPTPPTRAGGKRENTRKGSL